jgi:hypothetical protein
MEAYYHITSATDYPASPTDEWEGAYRRDYPCWHRKNEQPLEMTVKDPGEDIALTLDVLGAAGIIRSDFLGLLGKEGSRYLLLGNVFDANGQRLACFHTLGTDYSLRLRGSKRSTRQFCKICGQLLYHPLDKRYVLQSDLRDRPLYYSKRLMSGLLVREDLYARLKPLRFKKLYITKMPVLEKPEDGLPADLSEVTPENLVPVYFGHGPHGNAPKP